MSDLPREADSRPRVSASLVSVLARREVVILLGILVLGLALRLNGLGDAWLNPDEGIYYSMTAWSDIEPFWDEVAANAHPPLYYLLLRGIASWTPDFWYYRLFSVISGVLAIVGVWLLVRALFVDARDTVETERAHESPPARDAAIVATLGVALLVAIAPGQILISQIIRPYAFLVATLALSFAGLVLWLRGGGLLALALHVGTTVLALLTHYSAFMIAPGMGFLVLLAFLRGVLRGRRVGVLALAQIPALVVVALLYVYHLRPRLVGSALEAQALADGGWLRPFLIGSWSEVWLHTQGFLGYVAGLHAHPVVMLLVAIGVCASLARRDWRSLGLVLVVWATAVVLAAAGKYPVGATRHASWLLPVFAIAVGAGLRAILSLPARIASAALAMLVLVGTFVGPEASRVLTLGYSMMRTQSEDPVPRRSVGDFTAIQREIESKPGYLITDMQSYYTLLPLYRRSRERAIKGPDPAKPEWVRYQWGRHEVNVAWAWQLSTEAKHFGTPAHILDLVRARDGSVSLGPRLAEQDEVLVLWAGWPSIGPVALARYDERRPENERLIKSAFKRPGITLYRLRLKAFLAAIQADR